ncbi:protein-serine/threonine phosphatase [Trifolium repens]|nr:protein-serine/threonine phosphatase [Trifolium repens]
MRIRYLHIKLKAFKLKRFLLRFLSRKRRLMPAKKPSWMTPVTHGYQVVEHHMIRDGSDYSDIDSIVVQREQMDQTELWYFGIFDPLVGDKVTKYMQSHFFTKKLQEAQIWRKSKEMMKKAYLGVRSKMKEEQRYEDTCRMSSASVMVINGEKLVIANIGNYRVVVCKDGMAHQKVDTYQQSGKRHWSRKIFSAYESGNAVATRHSSSSELVIRSENIDSDTEFLILASSGIWEVMKNQEAVNLISHIEDPQEAAECLANEALNRMSKSNISCLIIRFD